MSHIKYVIRRQEFSYNDEWYSTDDATLGEIQKIYTDKAEAEKAYKALIIESLYEMDFSQYDIGNGYGSDELDEHIHAFILEKTGEEFDGETIPQLNDDDAFEFAQLSGILNYQLIEFDDKQPNYVIWLPHQNDYLNHYNTGSIAFGNSADFLQDQDLEWYLLDQFTELEDAYQGSLSQLSDTPEILNTFIETHHGVRYDQATQILKFDAHYEEGYNTINGLNALLKQPLFEIRVLTLEQIQVL